MRHRLLPPTAHFEQPDPEINLDVVAGEAREWEPGVVLSNSFASVATTAAWCSHPFRLSLSGEAPRPGSI